MLSAPSFALVSGLISLPDRSKPSRKSSYVDHYIKTHPTQTNILRDSRPSSRRSTARSPNPNKLGPLTHPRFPSHHVTNAHDSSGAFTPRCATQGGLLSFLNVQRPILAMYAAADWTVVSSGNGVRLKCSDVRFQIFTPCDLDWADWA